MNFKTILFSTFGVVTKDFFREDIYNVKHWHSTKFLSACKSTEACGRFLTFIIACSEYHPNHA